MTSTSVNIALSSLARELVLTERSLIWVVNAYLLTFGGFLLVGGRLGDLYGHSRMFVLGVVVFTVASLGCGLAGSTPVLIASRAVQGVGAAMVSAAALSVIANVFTTAATRARALSLRAAAGAGGGSIGLLFGGLLTHVVGWRGVFLTSGILGACVCVLCYCALPRSEISRCRHHLDIAGAVTATASLILVSYVIIGSDPAGWYTSQSLVLLSIGLGLLVSFVSIERRAPTPLLPLELLRVRNFAVTNVAAALWSAAALGWNVVTALYLQRVIGYRPLQVGLMFLPASAVGALVALYAMPKLVDRFGFKPLLVGGLLASTAGLHLLAHAARDAGSFLDLLPGMLLMGLSTGVAYSPLMLGALAGVPQQMSGAVSGSINSSLTMGGAVGLAVLMSIAATRTTHLLTTGMPPQSALGAGYRIVFLCGAACAALAAALALLARNESPRTGPEATRN